MGGQYIGQAQQQLPSAVTAEDREYPVEIDVGRVRISFQKQKAKPGKFSH